MGQRRAVAIRTWHHARPVPEPSPSAPGNVGRLGSAGWVERLGELPRCCPAAGATTDRVTRPYPFRLTRGRNMSEIA
jgi:hypothetical protein